MPGSSSRPGGWRNSSTSCPRANCGMRVSSLVDTTTVLDSVGSVCAAARLALITSVGTASIVWWQQQPRLARARDFAWHGTSLLCTLLERACVPDGRQSHLHQCPGVPTRSAVSKGCSSSEVEPGNDRQPRGLSVGRS